MKHMILCKFLDRAVLTDALTEEIRALFAPAAEIPGIEKVTLQKNCIDRPNRYDLLITLTMDEAVLPVWDASAIHALWKERYGALLEKKAIFDTED